MPLLFPTQDALHDIFASQTPRAWRTARTQPVVAPQRARESLFPAWSAVDDVKSKASELKQKAAEGYGKASQAAQAKTGKIVPHSFEYYVACTIGGILACVSSIGKASHHHGSCSSVVRAPRILP
jgi:solute carrier family 25 (mitochondrial phosphate transporter), member 3